MAANSNRYNVVLVDAQGNIAKTAVPIAATIFSPSATVPTAIKAAIQGVSCASSELSTQGAPPTLPSPGTTFTISMQDKVVTTFTGADNSTENIKVPGPITTIYENDNETLDITNVTVAAWATAMAANAVTKANQPFSLTSGTRIETKPIKR
jgi:hypothetical protein